MARAFAESAGPVVDAGIIAGPRADDRPVPRGFEWVGGSHPWPDALSERAGRRSLALAGRSRDGALLVLLSGGASALLAAPAEGLTLADKAQTARRLMLAGMAIDELNCVRKHLSAIKGGRLAAAAATRTITLAISDVHGPRADDPSVIGSGPTVADDTTFADALAIVTRADPDGTVPRPVLAHLKAGARGEVEETPKPGDVRLLHSSYEVLANRHLAMEGAAREARRRGYAVRVIERATSGEAREAGVDFATHGIAQLRHGPQAFCVIASGETTVRVRGDGRGGRNQEFALATVPLLESVATLGIAAALASAGTDGIDGPTDAAGAIADTKTAVRARRAGLERARALENNGAYDFFAPLGDLIMWGPTGTNVGDVHVMVIGRRKENG